MVTARFRKLAGPTAEAMAKAYELANGGENVGAFPCPSKCGGTVRFTATPGQPHRHAGSCTSTGCVRWAAQ